MRPDPRLLRRASPGATAVVVASSLLGTLAWIGFAYSLSLVVNGVMQSRPVETLVPEFVGMAACGSLRALVSWVSARAGAEASRRARKKLREDMLGRLAADALPARDGVAAVAALIRGIDALDPWFSQYLPAVLVAVLAPLLVLAFVLPSDLLSGAILFFSFPLIPVFLALIGMAAGRMQQKQWSALLRLGGQFLETLRGLEVIRLFGIEPQKRDEVRVAALQFRDATLAVLKVAFLSALALELAATISTALVAVQAGVRLLYGHMEFQTALFVLVLAPEFYAPLRNLGLKHHAALEGSEAADRLFSLFSHAKPTTDSLPAMKASLLRNERVDGMGLVCRAISHHYPGSTSPALVNVSFEISDGTSLVLAGASGAGKTTLSRIVLGLLTPDSGQVFLGGRSLASVPPEQWRRWVAWVPQNPRIFHASLAQNIALGITEIDETQILDAAEKAGLMSWIRSLPQGLDTPMGEEGAEASGGQRQRIAIARAILKNAPLLVLDEPTSQLDPQTEDDVMQRLSRHCRGRTVLHIAHRRSTLVSSPATMFLDQGRLLAVGSHEELLRTCPPYALALGTES